MDTIARPYVDNNTPMPDWDRVLVREVAFSGGKRRHDVECWPTQEFLENNRKSDLINFKITRIDWSLGDDYIDSIKFTMSNGDVSPRYGRRMTNHYCMVEGDISTVTMIQKDGRLAGVIFGNATSGDILRIEAPSVNEGETKTSVESLYATESLIGFKMRLHRGALTGLSSQWITSPAALLKANSRQ